MAEVVHPVQRARRSVGLVLRPSSVDDALAALAADPSLIPVAGGTDLLVEFAHGGGEPASLLDLTGIGGPFAEIIDNTTEAAGTIVIGGGATHGQVVAHPAVVDLALPLAQASAEVGSPQLRNRATVAGNLATASPANDTLSALLALDASVELARSGPDGETTSRIVALSDFFTGFRSTARQADELIVAIHVPTSPGARGMFAKLGLRRSQAISVVHVAAVLEFDDDDATVRSARVACGSVAPTVVVIPEIADTLVGRALTADTIDAAAAAAEANVAPIDDLRATADYRTDLVATLVRRMLRTLADGRERERWVEQPVRLGRRQAAPPARPTVDDTTPISATVNGRAIEAPGAASANLLDWLRDRAGLTGAKEGCAEGECGACTVHLNGQAVMSCLVPAAQADGGTVTTVEGLAAEGTLGHLQQAFLDDFAVQCGFCIPGILMAADALLDENPAPTSDQITAALGGNLCRCTGYYPIVEAIADAAGRDHDRGQR